MLDCGTIINCPPFMSTSNGRGNCEYYLDEESGQIVERIFEQVGDLRVIEGGREGGEEEGELTKEEIAENERALAEALLSVG